MQDGYFGPLRRWRAPRGFLFHPIVRVTAWLVVWGLPVLACGCGRGGVERVPVSGSVSFQGEPIPRGQIRFRPIKGTEGPVSGAFIVDGKYVAEGNGGVPVGTHRVEIIARRVDSQTPSDGYRGSVAVQYLPKQYNTESKLEISVPSGSGQITQDFHLTR